MITFAEIETELEKAGASRELSRSITHALELSQRKAPKVKNDHQKWMAGMIEWMFILWFSQLVAIAGMLLVFLKLLRA